MLSLPYEKLYSGSWNRLHSSLKRFRPCSTVRFSVLPSTLYPTLGFAQEVQRWTMKHSLVPKSTFCLHLIWLLAKLHWHNKISHFFCICPGSNSSFILVTVTEVHSSKHQPVCFSQIISCHTPTSLESPPRWIYTLWMEYNYSDAAHPHPCTSAFLP